MTEREKTMFHIGAAGVLLLTIANGNPKKALLKRVEEHAALVRKDFQTLLKTATKEEWKAYQDGKEFGKKEVEAMHGIL